MTRNSPHPSAGQAVLAAVVFLVAATLALVGGLARPLLGEASAARNLLHSKQSYALAEGLAEDVAYRISRAVPVSETESLAENGARAEAIIEAVPDGRRATVRGEARDLVRTVTVTLAEGDGLSFAYGLQAGEGGIRLENTASVRGNVYATGAVRGFNSNAVYGDVISAGPAGLIEGVNATGSAYAHTIRNSDIGGDAYYQVIANTDVGGTLFPGSPDQPTTTLPIPESLLEEWKDEAAAGGTISGPCPYRISSAATLGPKKIACDLELTSGAELTLTGGLWVVGDISVKNDASARVDASLTGKSVPVIADNPADRTAKSKIILENSSYFGAGERSFILFVSANRSAEEGGSVRAIEAKNTIEGDILLYAGRGEILLQNSVEVKEAAAWRIRAKNSAEVLYETGIANLLFTTAPTGGFSFDGWEETE